MSAVATAVVGAAVIGGAVSAGASRRAASAQSAAARAGADAQGQATADTNALQYLMYQQNMATQAPQLQAGQSALAALQQGLGFGQLRATQPGVPETREQIRARLTSAFTDPSLGGNNIDDLGLDAAVDAELARGNVTNYGASQAELNAAAGTMRPGQLNQPFAPSALTTDPSYQWRLAQGQRTLEAGAAARGGLLTGQGGVDLINYGQGAASQEYQAAFDRNRTSQADLYNRLSTLAGVGQTATGAMGAAGQNMAGAIGQNTMTGVANQNTLLGGAAQAQGAGYLGQANAWNNALQGGVSNWTTLQGQRANALVPGGTGYNYMPATQATMQGQIYGPPAPPTAYTG